jgi:hypothetical protein
MWAGSWNDADTVYTGTFTDVTAMMMWAGAVTVQSDSSDHFVWDGSWSNILTPDGTDLEAPSTGQDGSSAGTLRTAYGFFSFGDLVEPNFRGGGPQFYEVMLNGFPVNPAFNVMLAQRMFVGFGGNLYASFIGDELIGAWTDNSWNGDNGQTGPGDFPGAGGNQVPIGVPTPPPLPSIWNGPYTPSPDGTSISGGVESLSTFEGEWTFGAASGEGWVLQLNGVPVQDGLSHFDPIIVTQMEVNAFGCLFVLIAGGGWQVWNCHQLNNVAGPTSGPIPVRIRFPGGGAILPTGSPVGTLISAVDVQMSDGSPFVGTLTVGTDEGGTQSMINSGNSAIVTNVAPWAGSSFSPVTVTQNGCTLVSKLHAFND